MQTRQKQWQNNNQQLRANLRNSLFPSVHFSVTHDGTVSIQVVAGLFGFFGASALSVGSVSGSVFLLREDASRLSFSGNRLCEECSIADFVCVTKDVGTCCGLLNVLHHDVNFSPVGGGFHLPTIHGKGGLTSTEAMPLLDGELLLGSTGWSFDKEVEFDLFSWPCWSLPLVLNLSNGTDDPSLILDDGLLPLLFASSPL